MEAIKHFFTAILYQPLLNALIFFAWLVPGHSIGWAIIILTIITRLILLPSNIKTLEQQRQLRALQPKLDALKEKHGDDKAAHSKATMELYASEKVSPFGSCLILLIQLPLLLVLYRVFIHGLSTSQYSLLYSFTPRPETVNTIWLGLDLAKPEKWIMPILVGVSQFVTAKQTMAVTGSTNANPNDAGQMMQKQMMYIFPLITAYAARSFPAALSLYWVLFSLFTIGQQSWYFRKTANGVPVKPTKGVLVTVRKKSEK